MHTCAHFLSGCGVGVPSPPPAYFLDGHLMLGFHSECHGRASLKLRKYVFFLVLLHRQYTRSLLSPLTMRMHMRSFFSPHSSNVVIGFDGPCRENVMTVSTNSHRISLALPFTVTLSRTKRGNMVRSDACSRHGHVGLHMDTTENGVDSDKTWCGQCAKLGRLLPSPSKTRRHSHIVNESIWSQISLPTKGVRRSAVIFLMGAVAMYMVSHALVSLATTQQSILYYPY